MPRVTDRTLFARFRPTDESGRKTRAVKDEHLPRAIIRAFKAKPAAADDEHEFVFETWRALWFRTDFSWAGLSKREWLGPLGAETLQDYWARSIIDHGAGLYEWGAKRTDKQLIAEGLLVDGPAIDFGDGAPRATKWHIAHLPDRWPNQTDASALNHAQLAALREELRLRMLIARPAFVWESAEEERADRVREREISPTLTSGYQQVVEDLFYGRVGRRLTRRRKTNLDDATKLEIEELKVRRSRRAQWPAVLRFHSLVVRRDDQRAQLQGTWLPSSMIFDPLSANRQPIAANFFMAMVGADEDVFQYARLTSVSDLSLAWLNNLRAENLTIESGVHLTKTIFGDHVRLASSALECQFSDTTFLGSADFSGSTLTQTIRSSNFCGGLLANGVTFAEMGGIADCNIRGDVWLKRAIFADGASLGETTFEGEVDLSGTRINTNVSIDRCQFARAVHLTDAVFASGISVVHCNFFGQMDASCSPSAAPKTKREQTAWGPVSFLGCSFQRDARFDERVIKGRCDFAETRWRIPGSFTGAQLPPSVSFRDAHFTLASEGRKLNGWLWFGVLAVALLYLFNAAGDGISLFEYAIFAAILALPIVASAAALVLSDTWMVFAIALGVGVYGWILAFGIAILWVYVAAIASLFGANLFAPLGRYWDDLGWWLSGIGAVAGFAFGAISLAVGFDSIKSLNWLRGLTGRLRSGARTREELSPWRRVLLKRDRDRYEHAVRFRVLRLMMAANGSKHEEARFFRLELRARRSRIRLISREVSLIEKLFGYGYGALSDFGESLLRPVLWLTGLILVSAVFYWSWEGGGMHSRGAAFWADQRHTIVSREQPLDPVFLEAASLSLSRTLPIGPWEAELDEELETCSFAQRLLTKGKNADGVACAPSGFTPDRADTHRLLASAAVTLQSIFSAVLIFLFALAVRRRFQIG